MTEGRGTNQLVGGPGIDTLRFDYHHSGMEVDLEAGTVMGDGMTAAISTVENVIGTLYEDGLLGDAFGNLLHGGRGDDFIDGREGNDRLFGGADEDELRGGDGDDELSGMRHVDALYGDEGHDICIVIGGDSYESCESIVVE